MVFLEGFGKGGGFSDQGPISFLLTYCFEKERKSELLSSWNLEELKQLETAEAES